MRFFRLDPQERLDFEVDLSDQLGEGETIETFTVEAATDAITVEDITESAGVVTAFLSSSDGVAGRTTRVTCHAETSLGRTHERTYAVYVTQR